ncbi:MAG: HAD family hydrolase [Candidatus Komeilibacteria bacterium]
MDHKKLIAQLKQTYCLLFDFDGTLTKSTNAGILRHIQLAKELGMKPPTKQQLIANWGAVWNREFMDNLALANGWTEKQKQRLIKAYIERNSNKAYPRISGLPNMLQALKEAGHWLGILSSRDRAGMMLRLAQQELNANLFNFIQGEDQARYRKPDPAVFGPVLSRLHTLKNWDNLWYIGDTIDYDLKASYNHTPPLNFMGIVSILANQHDWLQYGVPKHLILKSVTQLPQALLADEKMKDSS